jgi:hypothetical protein
MSRGKAEADKGVRAISPFRPAGVLATACRQMGARRNTGSPSGDCRMDQPESRERQAGPSGVSGRLIVPMKPGNAGGGKEPQLEVNARSDEEGGIGS